MSAADPATARRPLLWGAVALALIAAVLAYALYPKSAGPNNGNVTAGAAGTTGAGPFAALATGPVAGFIVHGDRPAMPAFSFSDAAGKTRTLADWKGKVVLVNLWATWCAPCRKEMPQLVELQSKLGSDDFEVVALSVDRKGLDASTAFLKSIGADALKPYIDIPAASINALKSPGLPTTVLVDRQGREIGRLLGPADWASPEALKLVQAALAEK
ncbi:MAG: TlpA disulfide reductase family protein [Hyphomicrobiales bacterium]